MRDGKEMKKLQFLQKIRRNLKNAEATQYIYIYIAATEYLL